MENPKTETLLYVADQDRKAESKDASSGIDQSIANLEIDVCASSPDRDVIESRHRVLGACPSSPHTSLPATSVPIGAHDLMEPLAPLQSTPLDNDSISQPENPAADPFSPFRPFNSRYWIGEEIGKGGMGLVYRGWDMQLQRQVAIKIIQGNHKDSAQYSSRFLREARIASQLRHPGILGIHDFDVDPSGSAYIIMDLISGKTMEQSISEAIDDVPKRQTMLTTFFQICQAVAFAHANGVVHRDLKPANIMVGDYGIATVLDWGLAKILKTSAIQNDVLQGELFGPFSPPNIEDSFDPLAGNFHTLTGTIMGTPHYLAPEQARGEIVDYRADVFALGGILCHLLTGSPPFMGDKISEVYQKSVLGNVSHAIEQLDRCGAPTPIVKLAKQCLDPDVVNRPPNAGFLVKTLSDFFESGQRRAEEELVRFFDLSLDLFCIANDQGYFWRLNENFTRTLGYSSKELTSQPFMAFVHPDDHTKTLVEFSRLMKGEPTIQFINRYRHKDGHYIFLEWTARSLAEEGMIYANARDISDRLRLEEEKSRIESDRFHLWEIVDSAIDAIIGIDLNGIVQSWNMGAEKLFGYPKPEMIGQRITKLHPPDRPNEEDAILERILNGERVEHFETVRVHRSGETIDISVSISPIRTVSGEIIGASKIARSIHKQRFLESELDKSQKTLIEFTENANVPLHCVDGNGNIVWANNAELSLLGYSKEEYIGQPIARFHRCRQTIDDILYQLTHGGTLSNYRSQLICKDGSVKDVAIYSSAYYENGNLMHTRCFTIDLTGKTRDESNEHPR
jgi:PAS domain S-box-containing protein